MECQGIPDDSFSIYQDFKSYIIVKSIKATFFMAGKLVFKKIFEKKNEFKGLTL